MLTSTPGHSTQGPNTLKLMDHALASYFCRAGNASPNSFPRQARAVCEGAREVIAICQMFRFFVQEKCCPRGLKHGHEVLLHKGYNGSPESLPMPKGQFARKAEEPLETFCMRSQANHRSSHHRGSLFGLRTAETEGDIDRCDGSFTRSTQDMLHSLLCLGVPSLETLSKRRPDQMELRDKLFCLIAALGACSMPAASLCAQGQSE